MKSLLTKKSVGKENKGSALAIGKEARTMKAINNDVIDSTIGMLFDENGEFYSFKMVNDILAKLDDKQKYAYPATSGDAKFHEAIKSWVFRDYKEEILSSLSCEVIASPGGTGAIYNTMRNCLAEGECVLFPDHMWTNYTQIAKEVLVTYDTYSVFDCDGNFNLESVYQKCLEVKEKQNRVLLVINDPCQNPTGYSMKYNEWEGLVDIINKISADGTPFILLFDMAYVDYDKRGFDASRKNMSLFTKFNDSVLTVMAFSGSKTLGLYGLRIGAQVALCKSLDVVKEFSLASEFSARASWSSPSILGMNIISEVLTNHTKEFEEELKHASGLLAKRATTFILETQKAGIKTLPYDCGFFATILVDNPMEVFEKLKEKNLYIIPLKNAIRITLSSITDEEVKRVVAILKEVLNG